VLNKNNKGFTLIELLIVVAIIGIIAAIAIPNLLNAIQRGKQKRTMGDMRTVSTSIESYSIDNNQYPAGADLAAISTFLEPTYIKQLPTGDGWNTDFGYATDGQEYTLTSYGKDKALGDGTTGGPDADGHTRCFEDDLVYNTGSFMAYPEGSQSTCN
jgi:type II secretion system protein G